MLLGRAKVNPNMQDNHGPYARLSPSIPAPAHYRFGLIGKQNCEYKLARSNTLGTLRLDCEESTNPDSKLKPWSKVHAAQMIRGS